MLLALLGLHAVVALVAAGSGRHLGRRALWLCAVPPALTGGWAASIAPSVLRGEAHVEDHPWVGTLGLVAGFRVDAFGLLMVALVCGIGVLVFAYASGYVSSSRSDLGRFSGLLVGFAGAMLGLVTSDNLLALFVFWELTSVTSYLLIGFQHTKDSARSAALQALLITGAGGLALLAGIVLLGQAAGTWSLAAIIADPPSGPAVTAAALCFLAGIATKSAQAPFHSWLPGAMTAPTPVSAYLHSATMVKAGVYLAARAAPIFAVSSAVWRPATVTLGVVTMLVGGYRALRQHDLKLVLAYGTISQLGLLVTLAGAGTPEAAFAGAVLLGAHAVFKASLFMVVGIVDHATGTRDLRRLSGLGRRVPLLAAVAAVAAASMAGLPPLAGFVAKEAALEALLGLPQPYPAAVPAAVVVGSMFTVAYTARFWWGAFGAKPDAEATHVAAIAPSLLAPPALLAGACLVLGVVPAVVSPLLVAAGQALAPGSHPHPLALWHGVGPPLLLSGVAVTTGAVLALLWRRVERLQQRLPHPPGSAAAYEAALAGLRCAAARVAAVTQCGSLPVYLAVILVTSVTLPATALLGGPLSWTPQRWFDSPLQIVAVLVAVAAAGAAVGAQRRFMAVLALGAVGYAVVSLYALHGAPDLALTQLLIETLGLVVFMLALRHLPAHFATRPARLSVALRASLSMAVGLFVVAFAFVAGAVRTAGSVSRHFVANTAEAGGRNVVNVVLVDFRGIDTLGEITVLAAAGLGFAALVMATRRGGSGDEEPGEPSTAAAALEETTP